MQFRAGAIVFLGLCLWPWSTAAQPVNSPAHSVAMIKPKRMEIQHHTERLRGIGDAAEIHPETQKNLGMAEELLMLTNDPQHQSLVSTGVAQTNPMSTIEGEMAMPSAPSAGVQAGIMVDDVAMGKCLLPPYEVAAWVEA